LFVKQTGTNINIPKAAEISKYSSTNLVWQKLKKPEDALLMSGWQITSTKSNQLGVILGAAKSSVGKVIVKLDNEDITTIEVNDIIEVAPPGTKVILPEPEKVPDVEVLTLEVKVEPKKIDLSDYKKMSYEDLSKVLATKHVQIVDPNTLANKPSKIECKVVGYYPSNPDVKAFVIELPEGVNNPNQTSFLNPLVKLFDDKFKASKQLYGTKFETVLDVLDPPKVLNINAPKEKQ
jgi:hypothetical protein